MKLYKRMPLATVRGLLLLLIGALFLLYFIFTMPTFMEANDELVQESNFIPRISEFNIELEEFKLQEEIQLDLTTSSNLTEEMINFILKDGGENIIGIGNAYIEAENQYNVNALFLLALSMYSSGWGKSRIALDKNNLFHYESYNKCPYECARTFDSVEDSIIFVAMKLNNNYLTEGGKFFKGYTLKEVNKKYDSNLMWYLEIAKVMNEFKSTLNSEFGYSS